MTILDAIIQGIVQGLTEFLPVSSSGHLAITQHITGVAGESNLSLSVLGSFGVVFDLKIFNLTFGIVGEGKLYGTKYSHNALSVSVKLFSQAMLQKSVLNGA